MSLNRMKPGRHAKQELLLGYVQTEAEIDRSLRARDVHSIVNDSRPPAREKAKTVPLVPDGIRRVKSYWVAPHAHDLHAPINNPVKRISWRRGYSKVVATDKMTHHSPPGGKGDGL